MVFPAANIVTNPLIVKFKVYTGGFRGEIPIGDKIKQ